ncbi:uncharacterized protein LOC131876591 [Cryptomeria japonica]|uniref:uncharacterized protein LOC131876591 n=1 Tax=Cryptomeria japonica TaxID=3369 RepID=UPI0027DA6735|nr:uncharacterized protein LOC131876591 [Cryptomeria japonica]
MGVATNNETKDLAMVRGIKFCVDQGYSKVEIEGDSQIVINAVIKQTTPNWKLQQYLDDIKQNLNRIQQYKITHVYREANRAADQLANEGIIVGKRVEVIKLDVWNGEINEIVKEDYDTFRKKRKKGIR